MMKGNLAGEVAAAGLKVQCRNEALGGMFQIIDSVKE